MPLTDSQNRTDEKEPHPVVERLVQPSVIVVVHEARERALQFPRAVVLLKFHDVLQRPVIVCDLAFRHRIVGRAPTRYRLALVVRDVLTQLIGSKEISPHAHERSARPP